MTAIDVGQGSSIFMRCPGGDTMLIDGGGSRDGAFDVGRYVVSPYLGREHVFHIERMVLTHPHSDHLNGLIGVLENIPVRNVWVNGESPDDEMYRKFISLVRRQHAVLQTVSEKSPITRSGHVEISILNPSVSPLDDSNDRSVVLIIRYKDIRIMIPGDISGYTESALLNKGINLQCDVLFVPHHGAASSLTDEFLKTVHPRTAVISAGAGNIYGFPHRDTLLRLHRCGTQVYRTDIHGTVTVRTDGHTIRIEHYLH